MVREACSVWSKSFFFVGLAKILFSEAFGAIFNQEKKILQKSI